MWIGMKKMPKKRRKVTKCNKNWLWKEMERKVMDENEKNDESGDAKSGGTGLIMRMNVLMLSMKREHWITDQ